MAIFIIKTLRVHQAHELKYGNFDKEKTMSYTIDDSGWTELEISIGLPMAMEIGWPEDEFSDPSRNDEWRPSFNIENIEILVSGLNTPTEVRSRISQFLIENERDEISLRYAQKEGLPDEFRIASLRNDAIPILIKSYIRKILEVYPDEEVNSKIIKLTKEINENSNKRTPFERIKSIQEYIHNVADEYHGKGSHLDLPTKPTRNLLSACRLHIGLKESIAPGTIYWGGIWDSENNDSETEYNNPKAGFIPNNKKRMKWWRVPQMKPISNYASRETRMILKNLSEIPVAMDIDSYRQAAIDSALNPAPSNWL